METECARVNWIQPAHCRCKGQCWWAFGIHARKTISYQPNNNQQQLTARYSRTEMKITFGLPDDPNTPSKNSVGWHRTHSKLFHPHSPKGCKKHNRAVLCRWYHDLIPAAMQTGHLFENNSSLENKLLVYEVILKPVSTYGIQLWGTESNSNLEVLERFQSKVLGIITDAPRYVPNTIIKRDLQIATVKQEARKYSANCRKRLGTHPNNLANTLFKEQFGTRRIKRLHPADLVTNG